MILRALLFSLFFFSPLIVSAAAKDAAQSVLQGMGIVNSLVTGKDAQALSGGCDANPFIELKKYGCDGGANRTCTPGGPGKGGLNPAFACRLLKYFKALEQRGCRPKIINAYRSPQEQSNVCRQICGNPNGCGPGGGCARPGGSCHQYGIAADLSGATSGTGCAAGSPGFAESMGLKIGYNTDSSDAGKSGHIQCKEKRAASCKKGDENICGPGAFDPSSIPPAGGANAFTQALTGQGGGQGGQQGQSGGSSGGGSPSGGGSSGGGAPSGGGSGSGMSPQQFTPFQQQQLQLPALENPVAGEVTVTCSESSIEKGSPVSVTWKCPAGATVSRGSTDRGIIFDTRSALGGILRTRPSKTTEYFVECLKGSSPVGKNSCRVEVTEPRLEPEITFTVSEDEVVKGETVTIEWDAKNVSSCVLTGPELEASGKKGVVETDPLERTTVYQLECEVSSGGDPVVEEREVRVVKRRVRQSVEYNEALTNPLDDLAI